MGTRVELLKAEIGRRFQAFECPWFMKFCTYGTGNINIYVRDKVNPYADDQEPLFSAVKCGKRTWFGHVTRHENLSKSNPSVILEDGCRRVGQRQSLNDNIKESTRCTFSTPVPIDEDRKMESVNARSS